MIDSLIIDKESILSLTKDFIYGELLDTKYFIQKNFDLLKEQIKIIKEKNKNYFNSLKEETETNKFDVIIRKALKSGTLEFGDQFYTLDMVKEMVALAEKKGHKDQLPKIFIKLDELLKESQNKDKNQIYY